MPELESIIPGVVIITYCIAEIAKATVIKSDQQKTMLPILCTIIGGIIGGIMYKFYPSSLPNCTSIIGAITSGAISGMASTGCNQIYRQVKKFFANNSENQDNDQVDENPDQSQDS